MRRPMSVSRFLSVNGRYINLEQITHVEPNGVGANVYLTSGKSVPVDVRGLEHLSKYLDLADEDR